MYLLPIGKIFTLPESCFKILVIVNMHQKCQSMIVFQPEKCIFAIETGYDQCVINRVSSKEMYIHAKENDFYTPLSDSCR